MAFLRYESRYGFSESLDGKTAYCTPNRHSALDVVDMLADCFAGNHGGVGNIVQAGPSVDLWGGEVVQAGQVAAKLMAAGNYLAVVAVVPVRDNGSSHPAGQDKKRRKAWGEFRAQRNLSENDYIAVDASYSSRLAEEDKRNDDQRRTRDCWWKVGDCSRWHGCLLRKLETNLQVNVSGSQDSVSTAGWMEDECVGCQWAFACLGSERSSGW